MTIISTLEFVVLFLEFVVLCELLHISESVWPSYLRVYLKYTAVVRIVVHSSVISNTNDTTYPTERNLYSVL